MQQLVATLQPYFTTKAPYQLPEEWRQNIVRVAPWVVLIGGIITVLIGWPLLLLAFGLSALFFYAYGGMMWVWLSLAMLIVQGILLFLAYPGLKAYKLQGWNYAFYGALISAVYGIVQWLANPSNVLGLVWTAVGVVLELFILFQVRDYYTGAKKITTKPAPAASSTESKTA